MSTKKLIAAEIETLSEDDLIEIYGFVRNFTSAKGNSSPPSFMSKLKRIKIDAPEDFSARFELYASEQVTYPDVKCPQR